MELHCLIRTILVNVVLTFSTKVKATMIKSYKSKKFFTNFLENENAYKKCHITCSIFSSKYFVFDIFFWNNFAWQPLYLRYKCTQSTCIIPKKWLLKIYFNSRAPLRRAGSKPIFHVFYSLPELFVTFVGKIPSKIKVVCYICSDFSTHLCSFQFCNQPWPADVRVDNATPFPSSHKSNFHRRTVDGSFIF